LTRFLVRELSTAHWFDISAARRDLGYEPKISIEEGIPHVESWLKTGGLGMLAI
jgi:nucleoside-diphosphate-sugar epimerase